MSALHRSTLASVPARRRTGTASLGHQGRMRLDEVIRRLRDLAEIDQREERSGSGLTGIR